MHAEAYIGWDIGGAHLKMAHIDRSGRVIAAHQFAAPLWQGLQVLDKSLSIAKQLIPDAELRHAVTTTAELADIFPDRRSGLSQLVARVASELSPRSIRFYAGPDGWIQAEQAGDHYMNIASANWHATASYAVSLTGNGILIDIGSTTTDIIPFADGKLIHQGYTDYERLGCHELIYTGIVRTPLMAITREIMFAGQPRPVVAEHFATMADVYRLTGDLAEEDDMLPTADGAGKMQMDSARRVARMIALDVSGDEDPEVWVALAQSFADIQLDDIRKSLLAVKSRMPAGNSLTFIGAGAGRFLVQQLAAALDVRYMDFADLIEADSDVRMLAARSAAAVSVAQLSRLI